MITDEMMKAANHAWRTADKCGASEEQTVRMVLEAAYPLIQAQVLEEAAKVCDEIERVHRIPKDYEEDLVAEGAKECAQAIRNLAERGTNA